MVVERYEKWTVNYELGCQIGVGHRLTEVLFQWHHVGRFDLSPTPPKPMRLYLTGISAGSESPTNAFTTFRVLLECDITRLRG